MAELKLQFCILLLLSLVNLSLFFSRTSDQLLDFPVCPSPILDHHSNSEFFNVHKTAIIRPFIASQIPTLTKNLKTWNNIDTLPCFVNEKRPEMTLPLPLDVIFYFSQDFELESWRNLKEALLQETENSLWKNCFQKVSFLSTWPREVKESYPRSVNLMFFQLFENKNLSSQYDYFLWMEPDVRPIRSEWADRLLEETYHTLHEKWMTGSIYRGDIKSSDGQLPEEYHINGNSIYKLGDLEFNEYLKQVRENQGLDAPFDVSVFLERYSDFATSQRIITRFAYSEFIQNLGSSDFIIEELIENSPNTFLIHSKIEYET